MEVFLYNSTVCRLCGEENDNGTLLYSNEENNLNLSEIINTYLPIKVSDDGQLPRTICPGCTIQLEATVEFMNLIINGQKLIRELYDREKEYKQTVLNSANDSEIITENIVYEINTSNGVYQVEHPIALQVAGLDKPKRKRGRPPKKPKSPEELAAEAALRAKTQTPSETRDEDNAGKRRRKTPTRFKEAVQGKELDRIFKEEGVTDGEESDHDVKPVVAEVKPPATKEPEVIGHMEASGELVVVVKGKGRGRPKGRTPPTKETCHICGLEFSCRGRYMSHIAAHGPVQYACSCGDTFPTRLKHSDHQKETEHTGRTVIPLARNIVDKETPKTPANIKKPPIDDKQSEPDQDLASIDNVVSNVQMPLPISEADPMAEMKTEAHKDVVQNTVKVSRDMPIVKVDDVTSNNNVPEPSDDKDKQQVNGKTKVKCNHCDKLFSNKQSKSLHIKAVHQGERAHVCGECGASFAYPRSLALHAVAHRRRRPNARGYACDLCGKVLNHPSSVVYHKQAAHAAQRYVCGTCGKPFRHKQLLQRHQLVHSQHRPFACKVCNATFKTKANLLNHQLLHSGVKKFTCEICKHKFAHKTSLTLHMRWHTGVKPFSCSVCGKSFSQKGNLSEHERIHSGEKPFQCTLCPRRFTTSSQHRLHAARHRHASRSSSTSHRRESKHGASGPAALPRPAPDTTATTATTATTELTVAPPHGTLNSLNNARFRCGACARTFAERSSFLRHMRTAHLGHTKKGQKQMSLLVNDKTSVIESEVNRQTIVISEADPEVAAESDAEERVIYVTYDMENGEPNAFHILDSEQAVNVEESKVLTTCELYSGPSLLVPQPLALELEHGQMELEHDQIELEHDHMELEQDHMELEHDQMELEHDPMELGHEQLELEHEQLELEQEPLDIENEQLELDPSLLNTGEHMPVTDEQGNPLHFTMSDGTRLAITSADGKSLQVITQDGQTIPVEINGFNEEEEIESEPTVVHQLDLPKTAETASSPVTHYFTIV